MFGIGAGCPGATALGHRRVGRLTLAHSLNHPRPKEITTFTSSAYYTAPVGVMLSEVILVGGGRNGQDGAPAVQSANYPVGYDCGKGGDGGRGGAFLSTKTTLAARGLNVVIGARWGWVGAPTVSSFGALASNGVGAAWRAESTGGRGAWYDTQPYLNDGAHGVDGQLGLALFSGVQAAPSGGSGGGGSPYGMKSGGSANYPTCANGGYGASSANAAPGTNATCAGGGGGGGGGGSRHVNTPSQIWTPGTGGLGAPGVVQLRFQREF